MTDTRTEDFLDAPLSGEPDAVASAPPAVPRGRLRGAAVTAGWLAAGLVLGAVGVAAVHAGHGSATTSGSPGAPAAQGAAGQGGPGQGGPGFGGPGFSGGGPGGGFAGEQHVFGTLTAINGSTFTVRTPSGTSTYTVDAGTALVKDGQRVSSLTAMQVGDAVVVHVYPQNGSQHVEVVIDGGPTTGDDNNGTGTVTHT